MRAYGVEFKEGPDGFGVYASKDIEPRRRARVSLLLSSKVHNFIDSLLFFFLILCQVIMEIPHELMITIRQKHPWMFFPDIVPIGHPIFDIINSTDPEVTTKLHIAFGFMIYSVT